MLNFRKASEQDIEQIAKIYADIHTCEENNFTVIGWVRGVYPTRKTAETALSRGDLFVAEESGVVVGSAIINQQQVDGYQSGTWRYAVSEDEVMVLHTLVISPKTAQRGYGKQFVQFYEQYALLKNCHYLRMDTNVKNTRARGMYKKLGYAEVGIVPCAFNGIQGVDLVLLEKKI